MMMTEAIGRRAERDALVLVNRARDHLGLTPVPALPEGRYRDCWRNSLAETVTQGLDLPQEKMPCAALDEPGLCLYLPGYPDDDPRAEVVVCHEGASRLYAELLAQKRRTRRGRRGGRRVREREARRRAFLGALILLRIAAGHGTPEGPAGAS